MGTLRSPLTCMGRAADCTPSVYLHFEENGVEGAMVYTDNLPESTREIDETGQARDEY